VVDTIAPYVTVHGDGRINANTAPEPVLAALPGVGSAGADAILSLREGGGVLESVFAARDLLREPGEADQPFQATSLITVPTRILVVSRGWHPGHPLTHEIQAVLQIEGFQLADGPRLTVRFWTERDL
jgi:hypothetical protein